MEWWSSGEVPKSSDGRFRPDGRTSHPTVLRTIAISGARQNHQDSLLSQNPYGRPLSLVGTQLTMGNKCKYVYIYMYIYVYIYIWSTPHDLPRSILYWNYHVFLHIKHNRKNNTHKRGAHGGRFLHLDVQYIWIVIIISNALLLYRSMAMTDLKLLSDHFTPWSASPYHLLHPFMQPIVPTTRLVLGHVEKTNKTWKTLKKLKQNQKNMLFKENVWFWLKKMFFWCSLCFLFFVLKWKKNKKPWCFGFLNGYDQSRYQKRKKT